MNLGLAIFLSAIFLGLIWLYSLTKDKINFNFIKRIKIKYLIIFSLIVILSITSYFYYPLIKYKFLEQKEVKSSKTLDFDKPKKETDLKDLALSESEKDVIFAKGIPSSKNELGYYYGSNNPDKNVIHTIEENVDYILNHELFVFLKNKQVIGLCDLRNNTHWFHIKSSNDLIMVYGKPDTTLISDDDLIRCYFYKMYNQIVILKQDFLRTRIIYDPEYEVFFLSNITQKEFLKYLR